MGPTFNPVEAIQSGGGVSTDGGGVFERANVRIFLYLFMRQICHLGVYEFP